MKAVIEKQHIVEQFFHAQAVEIPHASLTKMAMMKTELDLLSSSISGLLGKVSVGANHVQMQANQGNTYAPAGQPQFVDQALQPGAQIWPILDAVPAPYPIEVQLPDAPGHDMAAPGYMYTEAAPQPQAQQQAEEHQGPAIFQGFQPPPSYAWRCVTDASTAAPVAEDPASGTAPCSPSAHSGEVPAAEQTPAPLTAPRAKNIDMSSPLRETPRKDTSMKVVLATAMDELQRCRSECIRLRMEKRGGPSVEEFDSLFSSIRSQLEAVASKMSQKLEAYQAKSKRKDETIKRLYRRLQAAEHATSELFFVPTSSPVKERSPAAALNRGLLHDSPMLQAHRGGAASTPPKGSSAVVIGSTSPVHLRSPRTPELSGACRGILGDADMNERAGLLTWPPNGEVIRNRPLPGSDADGNMPLEDDGLMFATMPPASPLAQRVQATPAEPNVQQASLASRASSSTMKMQERELKARRLADQSSQKRLPAHRGEPQIPLRREVANLRRRDVDLAGQLRTKEAQVEQLTATLREMQLVNQRQIGLYKRQLHLKDNSLQALQEELMDRNQQVPGTSTPGSVIVATAITPIPSTPPIVMESFAGSPGAPPRSSRRHVVQAPEASRGGSLTTSAYVPASGTGMVHSASERRTSATGTRSGLTPRRSDADRGRGHSGQLSGKKDIRDRSIGAQPHSPRSKARDVMAGNGNSGEVPLSRRRTMPPSAAGRSTSAEERSRASWRRRAADGEAGMSPFPGAHRQPTGTASQKVLRSTAARDGGGPQTARQRR